MQLRSWRPDLSVWIYLPRKFRRTMRTSEWGYNEGGRRKELKVEARSCKREWTDISSSRKRKRTKTEKEVADPPPLPLPPPLPADDGLTRKTGRTNKGSEADLAAAVIMQACEFRPPAPPLPAPQTPYPHLTSSSSSTTAAVSSVIFDPTSRCLALMRADSSAILYPPLPSSPPFAPSSRTPLALPPPSTAACFFRLVPAPSDRRPARVLFLSAFPRAAGAAVGLRAWVLSADATAFTPVRLSFKKERSSPSVSLDLRHGFSVHLAGSVNAFALHSSAAAKIWIMSARGEGEEGMELVKCAVIDCVLPIYTVTVSLGYLLLGEVGGVRVFPLKPLMKGEVKQRKSRPDARTQKKVVANKDLVSAAGANALVDGKKRPPNGMIMPLSVTQDVEVKRYVGGVSPANASVAIVPKDQERKKPRTKNLTQNFSGNGSFFVELNSCEAQRPETKTGILPSQKAVAIHAMPPKRFLVLDSFGDLHLLYLYNVSVDSELSTDNLDPSQASSVRRLNCTMKVRMLAVLPDISSRTQIVWVSNGAYSIHVSHLADMEVTADDEVANEKSEMPLQMSVSHAVFTCDKIHRIVSLAAYAVLVLGRAGNMLVYSTA